jgi:hypothetical protein
LLHDFVKEAVHGKWQGTDSPDVKPKYNDLILSGHSEGGVVIRRSILDRYEAIQLEVEKANPVADANVLKAAMKPLLQADFILASYLRLFAPACMGTNFSSWARFLTSLSHLVSAITSSSLVRNELLSGSPILETLQSGTEEAHAEFREVRGLYTRPMFGIPDQIVFYTILSWRGAVVGRRLRPLQRLQTDFHP